ncbi:SIS domain-containing protein [Croceibacterium ferulae]|uniref:SIS domain-containing protein n=1 Tax=Croceibacterium ferulae TaxID=1854641 RepID=UPI000EB2EF9C|nr:SIS domain-containing protein [Croceibacterium ferulae]
MRLEAAQAGPAVAAMLRRNAPALERLGAMLRANPPAVVVTCARGSSDHAATFAKYLLEVLCGVPTASAALSAVSIYHSAPRPAADAPVLCIAISQSGRSPDLLASVAAYKAAGAQVVALVNDEGAPLADMADVCLPLCSGPELSVAATKSYICSLSLLAALAAHWAQDTALLQALDELPAQLDAAFAQDWAPAVATLQSGRNMLVIGRGFGLAAAQEAALKFKETTAIHAEAFSAAEVRHGPMAIVGEGFPVLALACADQTSEDVCGVAAEFARRGAAVLLAGGVAAGATTLPVVRTHPLLSPIVTIASFYPMVETLSRDRGLDPDAPPFLQKVTRTL